MRRSFLLACVSALLLALPLAARATPPPDPDEIAAGPPVAQGLRDSIRYVIVTTRALRPEFIRLAQAHTHDGLRAVVQTLESIRAGYPVAADDAERIRLFLQDAHRDWGLRWLLLGGDASVIPMRRVKLRLWYLNDLLWLPTDQYYSRLEGAGPAEGDSTWGGSSGDPADLSPILNVGRAPVRTAEEARRFVTKTLSGLEERRVPADRQVLLAAGIIPRGQYDILEDFGVDAEYLRPLFESDPRAHVARLYKNWGRWPGSSPESRATLIDSLNRGYDIAVLSGAGGPGVFIAGSEREKQDWFYSADAYALRNSHRLTRFAFLSAYTCAPDSGLSIGAALMNDPQGGAVAVLGPTLYMFTTDMPFLFFFFTALSEGGAVTAGEALTRMEAQFVPECVPVIRNHAMTSLGMVLFGDPALPWWSAPAPAEPRLARGPAERASVQGAAMGGLALGAPYPNPASTEVRLELSVPASFAGTPFEAAVFDLTGRKVRSLGRGELPAGRYALTWDLRSDRGEAVRAGLYFIRSTVGGEIQTRRVVVAR
jgi:hypothetical protein